MNKQRVAAVFLSLLSAPCLAAGCLPPGFEPAASPISTVAPEMALVSGADFECPAVQQATAAIQAATMGDRAYVPRTKDDNTPWRFDMSQNGKRMTHVEFDAWMKAKGIRVATGKAGTASAPVEATVPPPAERAQ